MMTITIIIATISFTLYPRLGLLQGKEPTGREPTQEKSQVLSPICLRSPAPQGGHVAGTWTVPAPELAPKFQGSPKPSLHKGFVLEAGLRVPRLQAPRQ